MSEELQNEFIIQFHKDFQQANTEGKLNKEYFEWFRWEMLQMVIEKPEEYQRKVHCDKTGIVFEPKELLQSDSASIVGKLNRKVQKGIQCVRDHGFLYTVHRFFWKLRKKVIG